MGEDMDHVHNLRVTMLRSLALASMLALAPCAALAGQSAPLPTLTLTRESSITDSFPSTGRPRIALHRSGRLAVVDGAGPDIRIYRADGTHEHTVTQLREVPAAVRRVGWVGDSLWAYYAGVVHVYTRNYVLARTFGIPTAIAGPPGTE